VQNFAVFRHVTSFAIAAVFGLASLVRAQSSPEFASPILPADHWAVDAARRAAVVGLVPPAFGWGDGSLTQAAVGRALLEASRRAKADSPLDRIVAEEWRRFAREFPAIAARLAADSGGRERPAGRAPLPIAASATGRFVSANGRLVPVRSIDRTRENVEPPRPLADLADGDIELRVGGLVGTHVAGEVAGGRSDARWQLGDWHALASAGPFGAWVGERAPDYGPGVGGGLIFDGRSAFAGGGIALLSPIRLPWLLRRLGYMRGEAFLSRLDSNATTRWPWVFGSHASLAPHPRLLLGATQAFMFSGEGQPPFTWRNFKEMFLTHGIKTAGREFENGIASVEARWRPPIPRLPAVIYAEWGTDDNHSAWFRFPAVVAGVSLPALPRFPALSMGIERASFAAPCSSCNGCACEYYATWYRHYVFMDGWTLDRQPIGHPLGGDGTEWLLYGRYDDAVRRVRIDGRAFTRERGRYNIFAPSREGRSAGGRVAASYRVTPAVELRVSGELERGARDWTASAMSAGLRWVP
jgi:hypothetical protein